MPSISKFTEYTDETIDDLHEHVILIDGYEHDGSYVPAKSTLPPTQPPLEQTPALTPTPTPASTAHPLPLQSLAYLALHFLATTTLFLYPPLSTSFTPLCLPLLYFLSYLLLTFFPRLTTDHPSARRPSVLYLLAYVTLDRLFRKNPDPHTQTPFLPTDTTIQANQAFGGACTTLILIWLAFLLQPKKYTWPFSARTSEACGVWLAVVAIIAGWSAGFANPIAVLITYSGGTLVSTLVRSFLAAAKDLLVVHIFQSTGCSTPVLLRDVSLAMAAAHAVEALVLENTAIASLWFLPGSIVFHMLQATMWSVLRALIVPFTAIGVLRCTSVVGAQVAWQFEGAVLMLATMGARNTIRQALGTVAVLMGVVVYSVSAGMQSWIDVIDMIDM